MQNGKDQNKNYATEKGGVSSRFRVFGSRVAEFVENSLGGAYFLGKLASVLKKECYSCRVWRIIHHGLWLWVKKHLDCATKPEPDATEPNFSEA